MDRFNNKYRISSHRMPNWDYSGDGYYFITMVTKNRVCNLGNILKTKNAVTHGRAFLMELSDFGKIVENEWNKSFKIRNELFLDEYIIMPNHLHAIIKLEKPINEYDVETHGRASLRPNHPIQSNNPGQLPFVRKPKSISSFIGGFKSATNSKINDFIDENNLNIPKYNRHNHFWQPNYHDRIIRGNGEYSRIKQYIINNPVSWQQDKLNKI